jgi:phospholipid/cholesterol/gamma-HCH transport system ATP-binding protein
VNSLLGSQADSVADGAIRLVDVSCQFGQQQVLDGISLSVSRGETLAILGESGCGKSVTMKIMMQLLQQTSGSVYWFGNDVAEMLPSERRRQRLRLGYLFQGAALFDSLSVFDNVAFGIRENPEFSRGDVREIVLQRLSEVGLSDDVAAKKPSELSGGMQKRVGLARALALSPEVMFYDEPTTGLDPVTSHRIDELIESVRVNRQVAGIVVTHDLRTVRRVVDRVVMLYPAARLNAGESQILFDGSVDELAHCEDWRVREFLEGELNGFESSRQRA